MTFRARLGQLFSGSGQAQAIFEHEESWVWHRPPTIQLYSHGHIGSNLTWKFSNGNMVAEIPETTFSFPKFRAVPWRFLVPLLSGNRFVSKRFQKRILLLRYWTLGPSWLYTSPVSACWVSVIDLQHIKNIVIELHLSLSIPNLLILQKKSIKNYAKIYQSQGSTNEKLNTVILDVRCQNHVTNIITYPNSFYFNTVITIKVFFT